MQNLPLQPTGWRMFLALSLGLNLLGATPALAQATPPTPAPEARAAPNAPDSNELFSQPQVFGNAQLVAAVAFGDLNGDGWLDLVVGGSGGSSGGNYIFFNNGRGSFGLQQGFGPGTDATKSVNVADLNGDGAVDIVVGNDNSPSHVYLNNGRGQFSLTNRWEFALSRVAATTVADFNNDGRLDIATGDLLDQDYVYLNQGNGSFTAVPFGTPGESTFSVAAADVDRDGDLDLVRGGMGPEVVYYNSNNGSTFTPGQPFPVVLPDNTAGIAVGDFNGDGAPDIAVGNDAAGTSQTSYVYLNTGDGTFSPGNRIPLGPSGGRGQSIVMADLDGDGLDEVLLGRWGEPNMIFSHNATQPANPTSFGFGTGNDQTVALAVGDLNRDGLLDIALGNNLQTSAVYLNQGWANYFANAQRVRPLGNGDYTRAIALGDLNNDAALDVVVANDAAFSEVYLNNGAGYFTASPLPNFSGGHLALGDLDGDYDLDIVMGSNFEPTLLYFNNGAGTFPISTTLGETTNSLALGDMDGDGDLDLVTTSLLTQSVVYLNNGAGQFPTTRPFGKPDDFINGLAVGDVNGDGALDIAVGHFPTNAFRRSDGVYLNDGLGNFNWLGNFRPATSPPARVEALAISDMNGDGAPDLVMAYYDLPNAVHLNDGLGNFNEAGSFRPFGRGGAGSLAVADLNGDGAQDMVVGNVASVSEFFLNDGGGNFGRAGGARSFGDLAARTYGLAVGDLNGDGAPDIVAGNHYADAPSNLLNKIYFSGRAAPLTGNRPPQVTAFRPGFTPESGGYATVEVLSSGQVQIPYTIFDAENDPAQIRGTYSLDGGGQWFPAVAASGTLTRLLTTRANRAPVVLSTNPNLPINNVLTTTSTLTATAPNARLADLDVWVNIAHTRVGDVAITLTAPSGQALTLLNARGNPGMNFSNTVFDDEATTAIISGTPPYTGRFRPDQRLGLLDAQPASGPWTLTIRDFTVPDNGTLLGWGFTATLQTGVTYTYTWNVFESGVFGQSDNVVFRVAAAPLALSSTTPVSNTYQYSRTLPGPWLYADYASATPPVRVRGTQLRVMNGAQPAVNALVYRLPAGADTASVVGDLSGTAFRTNPQGYLNGRQQVFAGEGLVALAPVSETTTTRAVYTSTDVPKVIPGSGSELVITSTLNITATGQIVDVDVLNLNGTHTWMSDLSFYLRSPAGTEIQLMEQSCASFDDFNLSLNDDVPAGPWPCPPTDGDAYQPTEALSAFDEESAAGTWTLTIIDHADVDGGSLDGWALALTTRSAESSQLYYASAAPTSTGLNFTPATANGVQTLTVTSAYPLLVFNLDVSLEWDAHLDEQYLETLEFNLKRASEILYDYTDGQAVLGQLRVYQNRERWNTAHIRIYANNRLRPFAAIGGVTSQIITDPVTSTFRYQPGQVSMAATWNRYGNPGVTIGEDWPRTLAHELGHYLFFQDDNYLGLNDQRQLIAVNTCVGSIMADVYRDDYSELHLPANWDAECGTTLSNRGTGRSDWETVNTFYPALPIPSSVNAGPTGLPLAITTVNLAAVVETDVLEDPRFYLRTSSGGSTTAGRGAQAFLFTASHLTDLGSPVVGQVLAPGDQLCVFDPANARQGCKTIADNNDQSLTLATATNWLPAVVLTPITTRTLAVEVSNLPTGLTLQARVYTKDDRVSDAFALTENSGVYSATTTFEEVVFGAQVQVWVASDPGDNPRMVVAAYSLGGNPAEQRSGFAEQRSGFAEQRSGFAPVLSGDGQVLLYTQGMTFPVGTYYAIQGATYLPNTPSWATPVGRGYWLLASAGAPSLTNSSLNISYADSDVPVGGESGLRIYTYLSGTWQALPSTVNAEENSVVTVINGTGLYALMTSLEIPLYAGWNLMAYPVQETRGVTAALVSISGVYTTVYGYVPTDTVDPWRVFDITLPDNLNDLRSLEYGHGYWILTAQDTVLRLNGQTDGLALTELKDLAPPAQPAAIELPPSMFYGPVTGNSTFTPTVGMSVTAWVGNTLCGRGTVQLVNSTLMYAVKVRAAGVGAISTCGIAGSTVTFQINGQPMTPQATWNDLRVQLLPLGAGITQHVLYGPVIGR